MEKNIILFREVNIYTPRIVEFFIYDYRGLLIIKNELKSSKCLGHIW